MPARLALQANIRPKAGDIPFISAAWMGFAHADNIVNLQIWQHVGISSD
jgi:hypothetical protein